MNMKQRTLKSLSWLVGSLYLVSTMSGCATPAAIEYAEKQATKPPSLRKITDVYFAALSSPETLRLCVLTDAADSDEPVPATLTIDLVTAAEGLTNRGDTAHDEATTAYNTISKGARLKNNCEPTLQDTEQAVPIIRQVVETADLSSTLQSLQPEGTTVFVLQHQGINYIALGSSEADFQDLHNESFFAHAEDKTSNSGYVLVPFAVVADLVFAVVFAAGVMIYGFACAYGGGNCWP